MAYSDVERAEALVILATNRYDFAKTAKTTGISVRSLKYWVKSAPKCTVPDLLERAIQRLLMVIPANMNGHDWAIALGILMDKWLLLQGMPTQRTEGIWKRIEQMNDVELDDVLAEAERILADPVPAHSGGNGQSQGNGGPG